jgi:hypothetical protein
MSDFLGEFRGGLDALQSPDYESVVEMYEEVASHPSPEVRAYCVCEGLRRGVIALTFGYPLLRETVGLWAAPVGISIQRPFVVASRVTILRYGESQAIDVFPTWPEAKTTDFPDDEEAIEKLPSEVRIAKLIETYFDVFEDVLDRKSLLKR